MSWVEEYFAAWARHAQASEPVAGKADRARMLAFMAPDIVYEDVPTAQIFSGHDGVIEMGRQALAMAHDLRFTCLSAQASGDRFAFETETHGTSNGTPFLLRAVSVGRRGADGKVVEHKDYWDMAAYLKQMGLMPNG